MTSYGVAPALSYNIKHKGFSILIAISFPVTSLSDVPKRFSNNNYYYDDRYILVKRYNL